VAAPSSPALTFEMQEWNKPRQEPVKNYQSTKHHVIWNQMLSELGFSVPPFHNATLPLPAGQEGKAKATAAQPSRLCPAQEGSCVRSASSPVLVLAEGLENPFVSRPISSKKFYFFICKCMSHA